MLNLDTVSKFISMQVNGDWDTPWINRAAFLVGA